jgi:hypothetical protein
MKSIKLPKKWRNGVWHNIFKADNIKTFDIRDNCLLDDFCDYCGYTIEKQVSDSCLIVSGPINFLGSSLNIELSIISNDHHEGKRFEATYKVVSIPFVSLVVTFREENGQLIVEDDLQDARLIKRIVYQPIADRFVSDGASAVQSFINEL